MGKKCDREHVDFFALSPGRFQSLCAELLTLEGLKDVQLQGDNCPAFDILASEPAQSRLCNMDIRWGVQCKRSQANVGANAFDEVVAETRQRGVNAVLLISATGFRDRAFRQAEAISRKNSEILKIGFWDQTDLRRRISDHPDLLKKYFSIDFSEALQHDPDPGLLRKLLSEACGVPVDELQKDFASVRDLALLEDGPQRAMHCYSSGLASEVVVARYARPLQGEASKAIKRATPYEEYISIEYHTTVGRDVKLPKNRDLKGYRHLQDDVCCRVVLNEPESFRFLFTRRPESWHKSHVVESNEYSWLLGEDCPDLRKIAHLFRVRNMFVDDLRLRCVRRKTSANNIEIVMGSKTLRKKWWHEVDVAYTVTSVLPAERRTILSSLHASAQLHIFRLTVAGGFSGRPKISPLVPGISAFPHVAYTPYDNPNCVTVRQKGPLPKRSGIVVTWREAED